MGDSEEERKRTRIADKSLHSSREKFIGFGHFRPPENVPIPSITNERRKKEEGIIREDREREGGEGNSHQVPTLCFFEDYFLRRREQEKVVGQQE